LLRVEHDEKKTEDAAGSSNEKSSHESDVECKATDEDELYYGLWTGSKPEDLNLGLCLYAQQFKALFIKRFIHSIRNKSLILSQIILPILILFINLIYLK
jgi:hypothetical protein